MSLAISRRSKMSDVSVLIEPTELDETPYQFAPIISFGDALSVSACFTAIKTNVTTYAKLITGLKKSNKGFATVADIASIEQGLLEMTRRLMEFGIVEQDINQFLSELIENLWFDDLACPAHIRAQQALVLNRYTYFELIKLLLVSPLAINDLAFEHHADKLLLARLKQTRKIVMSIDKAQLKGAYENTEQLTEY